ncbi:MAG TPA: hypothetical protein VJN01_03080, partial [Xanthomonadales bacterium]|nr:hypothetical protein [Xanthomonadales bacterium]
MKPSRFIIFACCLLLLLPGGLVISASADEISAEQQCVVLLHGLGRSSVSMKGLEWRLEQEGYAVVNKSYPWMNFRIDELASIAVEPGLGDCRKQGNSTINFVTHSLGGILLRQ